jgi:cysteine desulfurase
MGTVYFDNAASSPLDPKVAAAMQDALGLANPSSLHAEGRQARAAVDKARGQVASLLNASVSEIVFTASGTEADNLALIGIFEALPLGKRHLIVSTFEHPAVRNAARYLESRGVAVTELPVGPDGLVAPQSLTAALRPETKLVSVMLANNVIGTLQPVQELARIAHEHGAAFHTDAVQAVGKIPVDVKDLGVDLLSLSAHKFHGPKGVGALFVRDGVPLAPFVHGGGQERGLRSATENVPGLAGLGAAAELALANLADEAAATVALRDRLIDGILAAVPNTYLIGHRYRRLPGHVCLGFAGQEGEAIKLLLALDEAGIAVSTGSACSALHRAEPSYVLTSLGFDAFRARGSIRMTLGRFNTTDEVDYVLDVLTRTLRELRPITSRSPVE